MMWKLIIISLILINFVNCPKVDPLRGSITKQEQWAFIKFHVLLGTPAAEVFKMLQRIVRRQALTRANVNKLYREFSDRTRLSSEEAPREGRPKTATDERHKQQLKALLEQDHNWSLFDYAENLGISIPSVETLMAKLGARKIAARWVPHELTSSQKIARARICAEHLDRYNKDNNILNRIIAIDETWLKYYDPADYWSSRQYRLPGQKP